MIIAEILIRSVRKRIVTSRKNTDGFTFMKVVNIKTIPKGAIPRK